LAVALNCSANIENFRRAYAKATARYQQSLQIFRQLDRPARAATVVNNLAVLHEWRGEVARAIELYSEALEVYRALDDEEGVAQTLMNMAPLLGQQQRYDEAEQMLQGAIAVYRSLEDTRLVAGCLTNLGMIHLYRGLPQQAISSVREALDLFVSIGDKVGIIEAFEGISLALTAQGYFMPATRLLSAAGALREQVGTPAPESERTSIEDACRRQRQGLGDGVFRAAWQEGRSIPLEAAILEAQSLVDEVRRRSGTA
jgi:tetratricopeptide (TPR) repeat protein